MEPLQGVEEKDYGAESKKPYKFIPQVGKITSWIGLNEEAKHSLAFIVLLWVIAAGGLATLVIVIDYWYFHCKCTQPASMIADIKLIWELVTPIVTLVLGYEFGRHEK